MPTGMHDRFAPRGHLSPEQLRAYAEGRLSNAERHAVELHLENDPLAREAMDGLELPGAIAGLKPLGKRRPVGDGATWPWIMGGMAVAIIAVSLWVVYPTAEPSAPTAHTQQPKAGAGDPGVTGQDLALIASTEISNAVEIAETLHIGHAATDRHALPMREPVIARETTPIERMSSRSIAADSITQRNTVRPERVKKQSRQLMYLHDLKLVHPQELYPTGPTVADDRNVLARFSDSTAQRTGTEEQRMMRYTAFLDAALEKFVRNDHKGCLEELRFLLNQYPDDVNALFYAGLCSYNLGLNVRAKDFLHRAATHPVDVFDEEAQWYYALTLERIGDRDAAQDAFDRISQQGGFYAPRAAEKVSVR